MNKDEDYIVRDNEVLIVDEFTGRIMVGRRYSNGLHQAIEAKENVKIQGENKTFATVTFQNFFKLYKKISGMTGTAKTEESEFREIYGLDVVTIPTNLVSKRKDENDVFFFSHEAKLNAICEDIKKNHNEGRPVLVGTLSVAKSEELAKLLVRQGIKHNVLNAKNHLKEAEIIAQAGRSGAVTIATNMAGRGTDILLGGNSEFMAKQELKKAGFEEHDIDIAASFFPVENEQQQLAREKYFEIKKKFDEDVKEEKAKVKNELKFYDSSFIEEFGTPPSRENKEIMKPLYLYYRSLKNAIDLKQQRHYEEEPKPSMMYNYNNHGRSNSASQTQGGSQHQGSVNVRGMIGDITGVEKKKRSYSKNDIQLLEKEYFDIKKEQDGLKKILYKFQEDFQKSNNRKVKFLKDIVPVEKEYQTYKQNKNTLKQLKDIITDIQNKTCATTPAGTQPKVVRE
jgi:hypothetical protein